MKVTIKAVLVGLIAPVVVVANMCGDGDVNALSEGLVLCSATAFCESFLSTTVDATTTVVKTVTDTSTETDTVTLTAQSTESTEVTATTSSVTTKTVTSTETDTYTVTTTPMPTATETYTATQTLETTIYDDMRKRGLAACDQTNQYMAFPAATVSSACSCFIGAGGTGTRSATATSTVDTTVTSSKETVSITTLPDETSTGTVTTTEHLTDTTTVQSTERTTVTSTTIEPTTTTTTVTATQTDATTYTVIAGYQPADGFEPCVNQGVLNSGNALSRTDAANQCAPYAKGFSNSPQTHVFIAHYPPGGPLFYYCLLLTQQEFNTETYCDLTSYGYTDGQNYMYEFGG